ncbi:hypothetical protein ANN_23219 [Periplaneta americana]|uniref:Uncharacterized protein n=1 Tax=Periplaneta americana TaxID=6978 RepID=A0ABQ8SKH8_PERAM|nr:hypothetical protein ANN_23219 [Periplaneta americana]
MSIKLGRMKEDEGDNEGEMNPGSFAESYPTFAPNWLKGKPRRNLNYATCPNQDSIPGPLVTYVALYGAETWTLRRSEEKRLEAFEIWMWRRMERVMWRDKTINKAKLMLERSVAEMLKTLHSSAPSLKTYQSNSLNVALRNGFAARVLMQILELNEEGVENKVLRKIFGAMRDKVTGEWSKLHNAELHALYSSPDIIRNIKSRRLRWAGHVARMGESRNAYRVTYADGQRCKKQSALHISSNNSESSQESEDLLFLLVPRYSFSQLVVHVTPASLSRCP